MSAKSTVIDLSVGSGNDGKSYSCCESTRLQVSQIAMDPETSYHRYQEFQRYVAWSDYDVQRLTAVRDLVEPYLPAIVDDFFEEIGLHPSASRTMTGGNEQVLRLKGKLRAWLLELFSGNYDREYLIRHWNVGRRHVEIGLAQVYTITAIARLRSRLLYALKDAWRAETDELLLTIGSLNKLLDLDIAIIEDAYQSTQPSPPGAIG